MNDVNPGGSPLIDLDLRTLGEKWLYRWAGLVPEAIKYAVQSIRDRLELDLQAEDVVSVTAFLSAPGFGFHWEDRETTKENLEELLGEFYEGFSAILGNDPIQPVVA